MKAMPLFLIASTAIGAMSGYMVGKYQTESVFEEIYYLGEAIELTTQVQTLSMLRKNDINSATKMLERYVDTKLIVFAGYKETALKDQNTIVLSALKFASLYRDLYDEEYNIIKIENQDEDVSNAIESTLDFGKRHGKIDNKHFVDKYLKTGQSLNEEVQ